MGSSGAICGVIAVSSVKKPDAKIYPILIPIVRINILSGISIFSIISFVCLLAFGVLSFGVAHTAHITGVSFGLLYGAERYGSWRLKHIFYEYF